MSDISVLENGDYFYIMEGKSDADCWLQYKKAASPDEEIIIRLCKKILNLQEQLKHENKSNQQQSAEFNNQIGKALSKALDKNGKR